MAEELTRPIDLSTEPTERYKVKIINALLSNRMHSYKNKYFRLDVNIGRVILKEHPLFSKEDILAIELKELHAAYERAVSL